MAFLVAQELSTEVRCSLGHASPEPSEARSIPCGGPGLGTEEGRPPWAPGGLDGDGAPPLPSGTLPRLACSSVTAGSSSCSAPLSCVWLSPSALKGICSGRSSWAHLGVARGMRMPVSSRATQRVTLPTRDTELQAICK